MKTLITGGSGFIGSNLAKRCVEEGWTVTVVDDLSNSDGSFIEGLDVHRFLIEDFSAPRVLNLVKTGTYDVVFHLAAVPRVSYSVEHPVETHDINVTRSLDLIEACRVGKVERIVFASSSSVYGGGDLPSEEHSERHPQSPYALQKAIIEDYLRMYSDLYGLDSACMRFFNVFGPNQLGDSPYSTAVSAWLTAIKKGLPLRSDGTGEQSRDMCYVDNVVDACIRAAEFPGKLHGGRFNVACGDSTTNNEILETLRKRYPDLQVTHGPTRPGDVMHTQADINKAEHVLGYKPLVRFKEGLERTIAWYEENWNVIEKMRLSK